MPHAVIAYHLILTTYGFWLPNDPRGSGSDPVARVNSHGSDLPQKQTRVAPSRPSHTTMPCDVLRKPL